MTDLACAILAADDEAEMSMLQIATTVGCSPHYVSHVLGKAGRARNSHAGAPRQRACPEPARLGTVPDATLAREWGVAAGTIRAWRRAWKIPTFDAIEALRVAGLSVGPPTGHRADPTAFGRRESREWTLAGRMLVGALARQPPLQGAEWQFPIVGDGGDVQRARICPVRREDGSLDAEAMLEALATALRPILARWDRG